MQQELNIKQLNDRFADGESEDIIKWAVDIFGSNLVFASSFSLEDVVLIDQFNQIGININVITLDTGRLPEETYELMEDLKNKYGIEIKIFFPDSERIEKLETEKGFFSFRQSVENREECCHIRKIEPLARALKGKEAWITGLRRGQSLGRKKLEIFEEDELHECILKINPLAFWSWEQTWDYIHDNEVPYNKLFNQNYTSIGCAPCTRAILPGEHLRLGRWWWEKEDKKECGIHIKK